MNRRNTYIWIAIILYVCIFILGYCLNENDSVVDGEVLLKDTIYDENLFPNENDEEKFMIIMKNNMASIITNYVGVVSMGIYNLFSLYKTAILSGSIYRSAVDALGILNATIKVLPHSIELLAIIFSNSESMYIGISLFFKYMLKRQIDIKAFQFFYFFVLNLLIVFIAAFIEVNVSIKL
jgi:uncharacterized membrane protein SpoIIM required for sporulation